MFVFFTDNAKVVYLLPQAIYGKLLLFSHKAALSPEISYLTNCSKLERNLFHPTEDRAFAERHTSKKELNLCTFV